MSIAYLLDEHIPKYFRRELLLRRDPSLTIHRLGEPGTPPLGTPDPAILSWCEENGFILLTSNRHTMPEHLTQHLAAGRHAPGIFVIQHVKNLGELFDDLVLIAGASLPDEYQDQLRSYPFI